MRDCEVKGNMTNTRPEKHRPNNVEELYPKLVGLSLEELSTVVERFGSGIVGPPIDE